MHDGPGRQRCSLATFAAEDPSLSIVEVEICPTTPRRTAPTVRPAEIEEIAAARLVVREPSLEVRKRQRVVEIGHASEHYILGPV
jgi:hypothetical protein